MKKFAIFLMDNTRGCLFVSLFAFLGICVGRFTTPYLWLYWTQYQLQRNIEKWDRVHPALYQVSIYTDHYYGDRNGCHGSNEERLVTIKDGIVDASTAPAGCRELFEYSTIENTFSNIKDLLHHTNPHLADWTIEYDPKYGFITNFYYSSSKGFFSNEHTEKFLSYDDFLALSGP